jgi:hypothetical protein
MPLFFSILLRWMTPRRIAIKARRRKPAGSLA